MQLRCEAPPGSRDLGSLGAGGRRHAWCRRAVRSRHDDQCWHRDLPGRDHPADEPARFVTFGAACASCPLRQRCTTAKDGRSMSIHPHEGLLRAARAQARTEAFKKAYPTRSAIERIIAWTATQNGRRVRLRYLGTVRNDAWLHTRCAALNLRTLLRHGLTRRDGAWMLA